MQEPEFLKNLDKTVQKSQEPEFLIDLDKTMSDETPSESEIFVEPITRGNHIRGVLCCLVYLALCIVSLAWLNISLQLLLISGAFLVGFNDESIPDPEIPKPILNLLFPGYRKTLLLGGLSVLASIMNFAYLSVFLPARSEVSNSGERVIGGLTIVLVGMSYFAIAYIRLLGFYAQQRFRTKP